MNQIELLWVLYEAAPRGIPGEAEQEALDGAVEQVVQQLREQPAAAVTLHLSGRTLERLERDSARVERLREVAGSGRLELLAGGYLAPVLSAIPEHDAVVQLRQTSQLIANIAGHKPRGAWLSGPMWDPSLAILLARHAIRYTLLETSQLEMALPTPVDGHGFWTTERQGYLCHILGIDSALSRMLPGAEPADLVAYFTDAAARGVSTLTAACPIESLTSSPEALSWFSRVLEHAAEQAHWLHLRTPASVLAAARIRGRIYLPPILPEGTATLAHPPVKGAGDDSAASGAGFRAPPVPGPCVGWEAFLARYPESNLLHKKMLLVSSRVVRLARIVRDRRNQGEDVSSLIRALERAQRALFEAQNHAAYWPGMQGGLYQPRVRDAAQRRLLEARRIVDAVFYPEPRWVAHEQLDLDRDGHDEVLVSTPRLDAGFSVVGGTLFDLSYKPALQALTDVVGRRPEGFHAPLHRVGVSVKRRRVATAPAPLTETEARLVNRLRFDRYLRRSFMDHFLGHAATVDNFYQCRYPEQGDFLEGLYEVTRVVYDRRAGEGVVHLSRNGVVEELNGDERAPVRVEKVFTFDDHGHRIAVRYSLINRRHTPVSFRFGIELNFGAALELEGFAIDDDGPLVVPERGSTDNARRGDVRNTRRIALVVPENGVRTVIRLREPAACWWFPLETISPEGSALGLQVQGTVLMPCWDISLWGEETRVLDLSLEVSEPGEEPSAIVVDDEV